MAKESNEKTPKELTKKHLARLEKENRQKKFLLYGIIAIVVVIVGLIAYGILNNTVLKNNRAVAKVGNQVITVKQFQDRVQYERFQQIQTFETYATSYFASFFQSQLLSLQNNLDNSVQFGSDTLDMMIGEAALVQKAKSMGMTVSDAEIDKAIQENFQFYPSGTPTATAVTPTITYYPTSTLSALQQTLTFNTATPTTIPPTATAAPTESATVSGTSEGTQLPPSVTGTPTLEPSPTINLTPSETATITPTPTEYTLAGYQSLYSTAVTNLSTNASFSESELRNLVRTILYERQVYNKVTANIPMLQDQVWVRNILVATKDEAAQVETALKTSDWNTVCAKYSTDTTTNTTGCDLGWVIKGALDPAIEKVAFSLDAGSISDPVQTSTGYNIVQVLGHEQRQLTPDQLASAQKAAYKDFIDTAKTEIGFKKYDLWASVVPTEPTIPAQYRISAGSGIPTP